MPVSQLQINVIIAIKITYVFPKLLRLYFPDIYSNLVGIFWG